MKKILQIFLVLLFCQNIFAQKNPHLKIYGKVLDEDSNPISFVNIFAKGTLDGTISDENGEFSFKTKPKEKITICATLIGYEKFEKEFSDFTNPLKIKLYKEQTTVEEVEISASSFTTSDKKGVTLNSLEVVTTPGAAADVFRAIQTFPGLQKIGETAGLFVRGGDVSETAVFLDGALILHPYKYESPQGGFFGTFSPFLLKGTYFSTGGFSSKFGNALSGVLEMESLDIPPKREFSFGVGLAAISSKINLPLKNEQIGVSFSGNLVNTKPLFKFNEIISSGNTEWQNYPKSYDLNANFFYKINPKTTLKTFVFRAKDEVGLSYSNRADTTNFGSSSTNNLYNLKLYTALSSNLLLTSNVAFTNYSTEIATQGALNLETADKVYQFRTDSEFKLNRKITLESGVSVFKNKTEIDGTIPVEENDLSNLAKKDTLAIDYNSVLTSFYSQLKFNFKRITVKSGVRVERESISKKIVLNPRISATYKIDENSYLNSAFGIYNQFVEPKYFDESVGNPNLEPQKSKHFILGYEFKTKNNFQFRAESYYKIYSNLILEEEIQNYSNNGNGFARGFDIFFKRKIKDWDGWISYSFLQAKRKQEDILVKSNPDFAIPHTFSAVLKKTFIEKIQTGISINYSTGKPYTAQEGTWNDKRVPFYLKVDTNFSYLYSFWKGNLTVFYLSFSNVLGRENILDRRYSEDFSSYEEVKSSFLQSAYFGFSLSF